MNTSTDLRTLACFTVLARELHYGRAAALLYVSQPALSKQISRLERGLGVALFVRGQGGVALTAPGRMLLPEAQRIVELAGRFEHNATTVRAGGVGLLRLGYTGAVAAGAIAEVLRSFHHGHPDVVTSMREATTQAVLDDVRDGIFDAAFVRYATDASGLQLTLLRTEPAVLAVAASHPFSTRDSVRFAELAGQSIVMMTRPTEPQLYDHALALCAAAGFSPRVVHEVDSVATTLTLVAGGVGVAVVAASARTFAGGDVRFRPLVEPTPAVSLRIAYRPDNGSPPLRSFLACAEDLAVSWRSAPAERPLHADL